MAFLREKPKATTPHFIPDYIRNLVVIRESESHTILMYNGKSLQKSEIVRNNGDKYPNNLNCNVYKWPILPLVMPYRRGKTWDLQSENYGGIEKNAGEYRN